MKREVRHYVSVPRDVSVRQKDPLKRRRIEVLNTRKTGVMLVADTGM